MAVDPVFTKAWPLHPRSTRDSSGVFHSLLHYPISCLQFPITAGRAWLVATNFSILNLQKPNNHQIIRDCNGYNQSPSQGPRFNPESRDSFFFFFHLFCRFFKPHAGLFFFATTCVEPQSIDRGTSFRLYTSEECIDRFILVLPSLSHCLTLPTWESKPIILIGNGNYRLIMLKFGLSFA